MSLEAFTKGYIESALWTGLYYANEKSEGETGLDEFDRDDIDPATLKEMEEDCRAFYTDNAVYLKGCDDCHAGHDFFLTRNRHGAGYFDGDYPAAIGKALTEAAHAWGTFQLVLYGELSDDNLISHHG